MNLLLDTHVFLWWLLDSKKLSTKTKKVICDSNTFVWISAVSTWEIAIKQELKKIKLPKSVDLAHEIELNQFTPLPVTVEHTQMIRGLSAIHRDPFDRLLIAQAMVEDLILVTKDRDIQKYKVRTLSG